MESITVENLNPKAKKLLEDLADLNLISIIKKTVSKKSSIDWNTLLSKTQQNGVLKAVESINKGEGTPHKEVITKLREKFNNE